MAKLERAGQEIGGETYARTPRGFAVNERNERRLRHSALFAHDELPASTATSSTLVAELRERWRAFTTLHRWLVRNV